MPGATSALYDPLIERELAAIPAAADAFAAAHSDEELWQAVTRFAVLAYSPSQHGKRTVMACRAAYQVRDELGTDWRAMIVACATYAASSRQPWSEPPILDEPRTVSWDELRAIAKGDALLMLDTVQALDPLLGEKGRSALLRLVDAELRGAGFQPVVPPASSRRALAKTLPAGSLRYDRLEAGPTDDDVTEPLDVLVDRAIAEKGSIEAVRNVFVGAVGVRSTVFHSSAGETSARTMSTAAEDWKTVNPTPRIHPYDLARDYAQTLIAHAVARTLPSRADEFLAAVHHNLEHGESYAAWSLA